MSQTGRESFKHVKNFFANVLPKYFTRLSCEGRASVANMSPLNFGEFTMRIFRDICTNVV